MDYLKQFLTELTEEGRYSAEKVDNCAEVYISSEVKPVALLELDGDKYRLNLRCDLTSQLAAQITYDMTILDMDIVLCPDFFSSTETGIVYGEQALALYFTSIIEALDAARFQQEVELDDSVYIVQQPIYAYGNKHDRKNKMQKLWGDDLE